VTQTQTPLVQAILAGDHDADLDRIDRAIRSRKQRMFRPGTRVRVIDGRTAGEEGIVTKVNLKRISVQLDNGSGWLVPVQMLEVIS
jgi:transcription antitermination factor NusG